jgi:hypothetical protein
VYFGYFLNFYKVCLVSLLTMKTIFLFFTIRDQSKLYQVYPQFLYPTVMTFSSYTPKRAPRNTTTLKSMVAGPSVEASTRSDGQVIWLKPPSVPHVEASRPRLSTTVRLLDCLFSPKKRMKHHPLPFSTPRGAIRDSSHPAARVQRRRSAGAARRPSPGHAAAPSGCPDDYKVEKSHRSVPSPRPLHRGRYGGGGGARGRDLERTAMTGRRGVHVPWQGVRGGDAHGGGAGHQGTTFLISRLRGSAPCEVARGRCRARSRGAATSSGSFPSPYHPSSILSC